MRHIKRQMVEDTPRFAKGDRVAVAREEAPYLVARGERGTVLNALRDRFGRNWEVYRVTLDVGVEMTLPGRMLAKEEEAPG